MKLYIVVVWDYCGNLDTYPRTAYHNKEKAEEEARLWNETYIDIKAEVREINVI